MNNYFYVVRYFEEEEDDEESTWNTKRGTVAGNTLVDAMNNLEKFYPDIEVVHLYCLEGSDCGCLELDTLEVVKDGLPEF